jgi:hypothetical protein
MADITGQEQQAAQHQAALDAIAARQAGDFAAYSAALQRLYSLGITVDQQVTVADLQSIADDASPFSLAGALGTIEKGALIAGLALAAALVFGPSLVRLVRRRG